MGLGENMRAEVRQVADGTYLVHGNNVNWVILKEGDAVTLVDTGYPGTARRCWNRWRRWAPPRRRSPPY